MLNINNLQNNNPQENFDLISGLVSIQRTPQRVVTPSEAGVIGGTSKVIGDLCAYNIQDPFISKVTNALVMHLLMKSSVKAIQGTAVPEKFNYIEHDIKHFISNVIGGACGFLSEKATEILLERTELTEKNRKLLRDFALIASFAFTELNTNKALKKMDALALMQEIKNNPAFEMKNISHKGMKFFVDVIGGVMGSLAVSYVAPLIKPDEDGFVGTAQNGAIIGGVFAMAQTITHQGLTKLYNKATGTNLGR